MAGINAALGKVKDELGRMLEPDLLRGLCAAEGHAWRDRVLDPAATILLLITQALHGNAAVKEVCRLGAGLGRFSDSAYCAARARLPVAALATLLRWVAAHLPDRALDHDPEGRFRGHRVFHLDGSTSSMPDTPELQERFGQPAGQALGCGFPAAHILCLFHALTGMILEVVVSPLRTHDPRHAHQTHRRLCPGDLLIGDRAFGSFAHLALLLSQGLHGLFRMHQKIIVDFTPRRRHARGAWTNRRKAGLPRSRWIKSFAASGGGTQDQPVRWFKPQPRNRPAWMSDEDFRGLPEAILIRELRYKIRRRGFRTRSVTLATTLTDPREYPAADLAELYRGRWQVEINLRHLKHTLGMDVLRCKSADGVMKELLAYAIAYNLVCLVMHEAARRQGVAPQRISFVDTLRWLIHRDDDDNERVLPELVVNPLRPGRVQPRAVKRRPKEYGLLNKPRSELIAQLMARDAVAA